jgi:hypothetical protein
VYRVPLNPCWGKWLWQKHFEFRDEPMSRISCYALPFHTTARASCKSA